MQNRTVDSSFVGAPAAGELATEAQTLGANNLKVEGGVTVQVDRNVNAYASVSYLLLSNANQVSYGAGLRIAF